LPRLIRMPEAVSLGLHAAVLVAASPDRAVSARALAEELEASQAHLAKVMQRLVKAGLVRSTRGPGGGFVLDRPADRISLLEVYEAVEGPVELGGCVFGRPVCGRRECLFGGFVVEFEARFFDYLANTSLDALAGHRGAGRRRARAAGGS
jgi:Rrf2 family protein